MTEIGVNFLSEDRQLFPRGLGELLALYVKRKWPRDTVKHVSRAFDTDPRTAANVTKGKGGNVILTKAVRAEGWPLLIALGEQLVGYTYQEHLARMVEEAANVQRLHEQHRAAVAELEKRAAEIGLSHRPTLRQVR